MKFEGGSQTVKDIHKQIFDMKQNVMMIVVGQTGTGKSMCCLRLAECVDPKFSPEKVEFYPDRFMKLLNDDKHNYVGSAFVFEEAGVSLDNRNYMSEINKMFSYIVQTFRYKRFFVLFNVPSAEYVDKKIRNLMHYQMETVRKDVTRRVNYVKLLRIQPSPRFKKTYYIRPKTQGLVRDMCMIHMPSKKLELAYEEKALKFKDELSAQIEGDIGEAVRARKVKRTHGYVAELTKRQSQVYELAKTGLTQAKMGEKLGISTPAINKVMMALRRKGVDFNK